MIVKLIVLFVKLGFAAILFEGRKDEVKLWCGICLLCASLFEVTGYVQHLGASSAYLIFLYQVLIFVRETGIPYALLMAGIAYWGCQGAFVKRWLWPLLLLPPAITAVTLYDGTLRLDNLFFLVWCSAYLVAAILLIVGKNALSLSRDEPQRRIKLIELFIIPIIIALLLFHYWSQAMPGWSNLTKVVLSVFTVLLLVISARMEAFALQLREERRIAARTLRYLGTGASLLTQSLQNRLETVDLLAERIAERTIDNNPSADVQLLRKEVSQMQEILDHSRQHTDPFDLDEQSYSLNEIVRAAMDTCSAHRNSFGATIRFRPNIHAVIRCDYAHMHQVLVNLLHNGLDALLPDRAVTIDIRLERSGRRLQLEIQDNGEGIAPQLLPKLWEPFFTQKNQYEHLGLGLPYSRLVVEQHNGTLEVNSRLGQGTTARILLPMSRVEALAGMY